MIIDALTHVTPDAVWFGTGKDAGEGRLLREMDEAGVDRAVVVADVISDDFVREVGARHPDRLICGGSFNPARFSTAADAASAVRGRWHAAGFSILKLH